jgi:hypothetical protein
MKIIKKIYEQIEEELEGGYHYAKCAVKHKEEHPALARTWYEISLAEVGHVDMLHKQVVALISEHRAKHGQPPESMMAVYNFLHERSIEKMQEIKRLQELYRQ